MFKKIFFVDHLWTTVSKQHSCCKHLKITMKFITNIVFWLSHGIVNIVTACINNMDTEEKYFAAATFEGL